jgi:cell division protein FtsB
MSEENKDRIIQDFATNLIRLGNECRDHALENARLKAEVETLTAEVRCLEAVIRSHERVDCLLVKSLKEQLLEADRKIHGLQQDNESLQNTVDFLEDKQS